MRTDVAMTPNELYRETGYHTFLYQNTLHREFSDRALTILNLAIVVLVAGGVAINFRLADVQWTVPTLGLVAAALIAFAAVVVTCYLVLRAQDWQGLPSLPEMEALTRGKSLEDVDFVRWCIADYYKKATQHNYQVLDGKVKAAFWAAIFLAVEVGSTISVVILVFAAVQTCPDGAGSC